MNFLPLKSVLNRTLSSTAIVPEPIPTHHQWVQEIQSALQENRFCLYLQEINPLATLDTQQYYDVLLFLETEKGQRIPATLFQPIAEEHDLHPSLNQWFIDHFLHELSRISPQLINHYRFSISLSHFHFHHFHWLEQIDTVLTDLNIAKEIICFQVSEPLALSDLNRVSNLVRNLQSLGYSFTLDDCGVRMTSLSYLKHLPVDYLKISDKFIRTLPTDRTNQKIVELIHYFARRIGLQTIAKGVDSPAILKAVIDLGLDYSQGRYLVEPQQWSLSQH